MVETADSELIHSRRKPISALFPHAVLLARRGQRGMLDVLSHAARVSDSWPFMWHRIKPFIMTLFDMPNPPSLNWVLGLISPRVLWHDQPHGHSTVAWQAPAPSYTEEVDRSAVDEVLRVAFTTSGQLARNEEPAVRQVRALGDAGVLRSYLLLLWSQWYYRYRYEDFDEMQISIQEDFGGIGMGGHRGELIRRLDGFRWELAERTGKAVEQCRDLKRLLFEVDGRAEKILTRTPSWLIHSGLLIINALGHVQNLTQPSCAPCLSHAHNLAPGKLATTPAPNYFVCTFAPILIIASPYTLHVVFLTRRRAKRGDNE